ncbi:MAG TPA: DsrE family protein [bacterium]|nr:DsrE family protein [bacterium]
MRVFIIVTHPPYGNETTRSALRVARRLRKIPDIELALFLMADSVYCARKGEAYAEGVYDPELGHTYSAPQMLAVIKDNAEVFACGTCMGERDFKEDELIEDIAIGTLDVIAEYTAKADKVLTF